MSIDSLALSLSSIDRDAATLKISRLSSAPPTPTEADDEADDEERSLSGSIIAESYVVHEPIGRGGMGRVYEVEHARTGRRLAMKVLRAKAAKNRDIVRRFIREGTAISKLLSANTVQVFDYGVSDGLAYLVMELVRGETLSKILREGGPMGADRATRIVLDVCASLEEAHEKGIVHRDIKPDNVMIVRGPSGEESAKVVDFGLAKVFFADGVELVSSAGIVMGTPQYMAPEQIRGGSVDARTDVYSVGVLSYRMLTGHRPFSGNMSAILSGHLTRTPVPPRERAPELDIPSDLSDAIMMALAKDPADRFQSVQAFASALRYARDKARDEARATVPSLFELEAERSPEDDPDPTSGLTAYERALGAHEGRGTWVFVVALLLAAVAFALLASTRR